MRGADAEVGKLEIFAKNGGHLVYLNRPSYGGYSSRGVSYYDGSLSETRHNVNVLFDSSPPYYNPNSGFPVLDVGPDATNNNRVTVRFGGWKDDTTGIASYHFKACQMKDLSKLLMEDMQKCQKTIIIDEIKNGVAKPVYSLPVTLEAVDGTDWRGAWAMVLTVKDRVGNFRHARRLVLYDPNPSIRVSDQSAARVKLIDGVLNSEKVNVIRSVAAPVRVSWKGVFSSPIGEWLDPLKPWVPALGTPYDQPSTGKLKPAGTPNLEGVIKFEYQLTCASTPSNNKPWVTLPRLGTEAAVDLSHLSDGAACDFNVRASDIFGKTAFRTAKFLLDKGPPAVTHLALNRGNNKDIAAHSAQDLTDMQVAFRILEPGGLKKLQWTLQEFNLGSLSSPILTQTVPVKKSLVPVDYVSALAGDNAARAKLVDKLHRQKFRITVTAWDTLDRKGTASRDFEIDLTPPSTGAVRDAELAATDIDFTQDSTVPCSWTGFADQESGIREYRVAFGTTRLQYSNGKVEQSKFKVIKAVAQLQAVNIGAPDGSNYCCVVAVNNAFEVSETVCSNGAVVDTATTTIAELALTSVRARKSVAKDAGGDFWLVNADASRQKITGTTTACAASVGAVSDNIASLSVVKSVTTDKDGKTTSVPVDVQGSDVCGLGLPAFVHEFFISTPVLGASWSYGKDVSLVRIFEFSIGSAQGVPHPSPGLTWSTGTNMSVMAHDHSSIMGQSSRWFAMVRAVKRSKVTSAYRSIGPIYVDATSPQFPSGKVVEVQFVNNYATVVWPEFVEDVATPSNMPASAYTVRLRDATTRQFLDVAIGPTSCISGVCRAAAPAGSITDATSFVAVVRGCNAAGLCTEESSPPVAELVALSKPAEGSVFVTATAASNAPDVVVIASGKSVTIRWAGFTGVGVTFEVGVGLNADSPSVVAFQPAAGNGRHTVNIGSSSLIPMREYYAVVRASAKNSRKTLSTVSSSKAFRYMPLTEPMAVTVGAGVGCLRVEQL